MFLIVLLPYYCIICVLCITFQILPHPTYCFDRVFVCIIQSQFTRHNKKHAHLLCTFAEVKDLSLAS